MTSKCSNHKLDIDDLNEVFCQVVNLRAHWKTLGLTLGIKYDEIEAIETDKSSSEDRLMELLASWLRIQNKAQSKPSWKSLCDAVRGIDKTKAEKIAKEHQCSCDECAATSGVRNTPVGRHVQNHDIEKAAKALKEEFDELMTFMAKEVKSVDADQLRFRVNSLVKSEGILNEAIEGHLFRIEDCVAPSAIIHYLFRHDFIGFINYALIKEVQKLIQSKLLDKHIEEYEKDYQQFLQLTLKDIHDAFKKCPDLQPNYPVGLPKFTIHLESEWDGRSMYEWKEVLKNRWSNWPESLNIERISENCIIITYGVWPRIAENVVRDLTDPVAIAELKKEGVTIDISPQLLAYKSYDSSTSLEEEVHSETHITVRVFGKEEVVMDLPMKGQPSEGMLAIKPDWDKREDGVSGYVSLNPDSDGQTVASGDTHNQGQQIVELRDDITLSEAIIVYEGLMSKALKQRKSAENELSMEREMRKKTVVELQLLKEGGFQVEQELRQKVTDLEQKNALEMKREDLKLYHLQSVQSEREKVIETMREEIKRLHKTVKDLTVKPWVFDEEQQRLDRMLLSKASEGSVEGVESALSSGANIEHKHYYHEETPLHVASKSGHENVVEVLIKNGAPIEAKNRHEETPLHVASKSGHENVVEVLIKHGAPIEAKNKHEETPLHVASKSGHENVVEVLIKNGALIEAKNKCRQSPLHLSLLYNRTGVAVLLISHGANILEEDTYDHSPVLIAAVFNEEKVIKQCLSQGVSAEKLQKYHLPVGWKAEHRLDWLGNSCIVYTNTSAGVKQWYIQLRIIQ